MSLTESKYGRDRNHKYYKLWNGMMQRCYNENRTDYKYYGGRGIKVCKRWKIYENFVDDIEDLYKSGLSMDRIDNNGNYSPNNIRFVTHRQQCNNRRSNNTFVNPKDGREYNTVQISEKYGVPRPTVNSRIRNTKFCQLSFAGHLKKHKKKHGC